MNDAKTLKPRGFAALPREVVQEIARKGGKQAHLDGTAHRFTSDEARAAGKKGGAKSKERARLRRLSRDTEPLPTMIVNGMPVKPLESVNE
jgi:uncharacterized protein